MDITYELQDVKQAIEHLTADLKIRPSNDPERVHVQTQLAACRETQKLLMHVATDKASGEMQEALDDLKQYAKDPLPWLYYQDIDFILACAVAGPLIKFGYCDHRGQFEACGATYDVRQPLQSVPLVIAMVHCFCMLRTLRDQAAPTHKLLPMCAEIERPQFTIIIITRTGVEKQVHQFDVYSGSHGTSLEVLQLAHSASTTCRFLVRAKAPPAVHDFGQSRRWRKYSDQRTDGENVYVVKVGADSLGCPLSAEPMTEQLLAEVGLAGVRSMEALDAVGVVHRDLTKRNVLALAGPAGGTAASSAGDPASGTADVAGGTSLGQASSAVSSRAAAGRGGASSSTSGAVSRVTFPMIIDLELAALADQVLPDILQPHCGGVLFKDRFTFESDLVMLGLLLQHLWPDRADADRHLTPTGTDFLQRLTSALQGMTEDTALAQLIKAERDVAAAASAADVTPRPSQKAAGKRAREAVQQQKARALEQAQAALKAARDQRAAAASAKAAELVGHPWLDAARIKYPKRDGW